MLTGFIHDKINKIITGGKKETVPPKTATVEKVAFCAALIVATLSSLHAFRDIFCEETSYVSSLIEELMSLEMTTLATIDLSSVLSPNALSNAETQEDDLCHHPDVLRSIQQVKALCCSEATPDAIFASTGWRSIL